MSPAEVLLGLPKPGGEITRHAAGMGVPCLVSANALAVRERLGSHAGDWAGWRRDLSQLPEDCALDSGGFVAHAQYGGFPWSEDAYLDLVSRRPWRWWAQMDACCEPELARSRHAVRMRQAETLRSLDSLRDGARRRGLPPPLPVLQGWTPDDYAWHARRALDGSEMLAGVGSMCRRRLHGANGLIAVVAALDAVLAPGVRLHLFGVKSAGVAALAAHPRVASFDSMAWDTRARRAALEAGVSNTNAHRIQHLLRWHETQAQAAAAAAHRAAPIGLPLTPTHSSLTEEWAALVEDGELDLASALYHSAMAQYAEGER